MSSLAQTIFPPWPQVRDVMRLKPTSSLLWAGVPCSMSLDFADSSCYYIALVIIKIKQYMYRWVFMSSSVHKRKKHDGAYGNTSLRSVDTANFIATRTALLLLLAAVLDVPWCVTAQHYNIVIIMSCLWMGVCVCVCVFSLLQLRWNSQAVRFWKISNHFFSLFSRCHVFSASTSTLGAMATSRWSELGFWALIIINSRRKAATHIARPSTIQGCWELPKLSDDSIERCLQSYASSSGRSKQIQEPSWWNEVWMPTEGKLLLQIRLWSGARITRVSFVHRWCNSSKKAMHLC